MTARNPRSRNMRIAGAGAAGLAAVLSAAPTANAHAPAQTSSAAPKDGSTNTNTGAAKPAAPAAPTPNYGLQKYRVGVQIANGTYVPPGTTTVGSQITMVESGPSEPGGPVTTTCKTDVSTVQPGSTASYCLGIPLQLTPALRTQARRYHINTAQAPVVDSTEDFTALPGDTVTITQTSVNANLVIDPNPQVIQPCELPATPNSPFCEDANGNPLASTALFTDTGFPPIAKDDSATVQRGNSVTVDVLSNDNTKAPVTGLSVSRKPHHGEATVDNQKIDYRPAAGFVGTDTFDYTVQTANGSATATVTVKVTAPPPTATDDRAQTQPGTPVTIDVTKNDDANGGGPLRLDSVGHPGHGSARIVAGRVEYTPATGFSGSDNFTYQVSTDFGTDSATVTVTVAAPPTSAAPSSSAAPLANTGVPSGPLTGIGVGLLVAGGIATVAGRRRRGRHA